MKLLVFTAVWKRPEITEICFMGIKRLQKVTGFDIKAFAVISEVEMIPLCEKYGVDWCIHENHPLGAKKNYGVNEALKHDFEYMIEIGSDDLLKNEILKTYKWDAPILGLDSAVHLNTKTGSCRMLCSMASLFGGGRALSRDVLESGDLWHDKKSKGLDKNSHFNISRRGFLGKRVKTEFPLVIDLKSDVNIWPYSPQLGKKYPLESALNGLSEEEVTAIQCLVAKNKSASLIDA